MAKGKKKPENLLTDEDFMTEPTIGSIVSGLFVPNISKPKPKSTSKKTKSPDA